MILYLYRKVVLTKQAKKDLTRLPSHILMKFKFKFKLWLSLVEYRGVENARTTPGYNDEPLKGNLKGYRSIRLSRSYRAIYIERGEGNIELLEVIKVNKQEY